MTLVPMLIMVILLEGVFLHDRYTALDNDLLTHGRLIARQLAASSEYGVFSDNRMFLNGIAEGALLQANVDAVVVVDASSKILVSAGKLSTVLALHIQNDESQVSLQREDTLYDDGKTVLLYQPILATQVELNEFAPRPASRKIGGVWLEMNWSLTHKIKLKLLRFSLFVIVLFLLITLYLIHLASRRIIQPISQLSKAIHIIGTGNLEARVTVQSSISEFCALSSGINQMTADLQHEQAVLQHRIDKATEQLRNLAFYDPLTLLPNRRLLNDRLAQALASSHRNAHYGALMFLDLDNFKSLNDKYGHAVGDLLLVEAAYRISSCLREDDTVARFGGDEFVVMLVKLDINQDKSIQLAELVAEKIRKVLAKPYHLSYRQADQVDSELEHRCSSSVGVVLFLDQDDTKEDLMKWADTAMYQAKKQGRNRVCFYQRERKKDHKRVAK
ncbi:MAG: diguanylate cyclase [Gallionella sp.]